MNTPFLLMRNGRSVSRAAIPLLTLDSFRSAIEEAVAGGSRIASLFGYMHEDKKLRLLAVLAQDRLGEAALAETLLEDTLPALTPDCPEAHWFERELAEQWGVLPEGHPWLKPIRFHRSWRPECDAWNRTDAAIEPAVTDYFQVAGEEIHEVGVGPVHAGIIEPGHFRFQCRGEIVLHLEIELGYQHRGIERRMEGGPDARSVFIFETIAGDTTVGHAWAGCQALEALAGTEAPARAQVLRGLALELERLANHTGDLGALAGDVGFLPTASYCGRIRGDFLNMTAILCGSRFGRGLIRPGGLGFDPTPPELKELLKRLALAEADVTSAVELLWKTPSVMARFEEAGALAEADALALGLVGPAARACGVARDARQDFPLGLFRYAQIPVSTANSGDVFGRAFVRWLEVQRSIEFVRYHLGALPTGPVCAAVPQLAPNSLALAFVEGWRGEICHVALTGPEGRLIRYKIVDPSFHNWFGLALAMRGQPISDFPLCNKSFNLSYCGHDL